MKQTDDWKLVEILEKKKLKANMDSVPTRPHPNFELALNVKWEK